MFDKYDLKEHDDYTIIIDEYNPKLVEYKIFQHVPIETIKEFCKEYEHEEYLKVMEKIKNDK